MSYTSLAMGSTEAVGALAGVTRGVDGRHTLSIMLAGIPWHNRQHLQTRNENTIFTTIPFSLQTKCYITCSKTRVDVEARDESHLSKTQMC